MITAGASITLATVQVSLAAIFVVAFAVVAVLLAFYELVVAVEWAAGWRQARARARAREEHLAAQEKTYLPWLEGQFAAKGRQPLCRGTGSA